MFRKLFTRHLVGMIALLLLVGTIALHTSAIAVQHGSGPSALELFTLSGRVYEGQTGVEPPDSTPIQGVTVSLYCSNDVGDQGTFLRSISSDANGWYGLDVYADDGCEYFNIIETDPPGYTSNGATSVDGNVINPNWIEYAQPLDNKTLTGNKFWDQAPATETPTPTGEVPRGDLVLAEFMVEPQVVFPQEELTLVAQVQNSGANPYTAVSVRFLVDDQPIASATAQIIPAGETVAVTATTAFSETGLFNIVAVVNPDGILPETHLDNNQATTSVQVVIEKHPHWAKLDLALADLSLSPLRPNPDEHIAATANLHNLGQMPIEDAQLVLLVDGEVADEQIVHNIPARGALAVTLHWPAAQPGRHFLQLYVDPDNTLAERNKSNNSVGDWLRVAGAPDPRPDLQVNEIKLANPNVRAGGNGAVVVNISNAGYAPAADLVVQVLVDDREIGRHTVAALPAGETTTVSLPWKNVGQGQHVLLVRLDPENILNDDSLQGEWATSVLIDPVMYQPQLYISAAAAQQMGLWTFIGPQPIQSGTAIHNGRMDAIAISQSNSNVIILGSVASGIWRTENGGKTWSPIADHLTTPEFRLVALDPNDDRTVYGFSGSGGYVYKSTDAGAHWQVFTGPGLTMGDRFSRVFLRYEQPHTLTIYLASNSGLWMWQGDPNTTTATPGSWRRMWHQTRQAQPDATNEVTDILITTESTPQVYIGAYRDSIYRTSLSSLLSAYTQQKATTWTPLDGGLPNVDLVVAYMDSSEAKPDRIFAAISRSPECAKDAGTTVEIYRLDKGKTTWTLVNRLTDTTKKPSVCGIRYNAFLRVHPQKPDVLYIGGVSGWRLTNGGTTLHVIPYVHADFKDMAFDPQNPSVIFFTSDGGIYRCTNDGASCASLNQDLETTMFFDISVAGAQNRLIIGGTQDNGTLRYDNPALGWKEIRGGDGKYTAIDPGNNNVMYSQNQYADSTAKSTDGGKNWPTGNAGLPSWKKFSGDPYLVMHPKKSSTLLIAAGTANGQAQVYRSTNAGVSWSPIGPDPAQTRGEVNRITIDGTNDRYYAGTTGQIWTVSASTATSHTWTMIYDQPAHQTVRDLLVDPDSPKVLYAAFAGSGAFRVIRLENTGTWPNGWTATPIAASLPAARRLSGGAGDAIRGLILNPSSGSNTDVLYVGTDRGVYQGEHKVGKTTWTWMPDSCGLPSTYISDLELHGSGSWMAAATYGRGAYVRSTHQTSLSPDAYDTPTRNDTLAAAATLPPIPTGNVLQPGLEISNLNMDRSNDVDFFTTKLPAQGPHDCLPANDPTLQQPNSYQCSLIITIHAPSIPDPFELRLYKPDGSLVMTHTETSSLTYGLTRPYDIFPSGQITLSVRSLTGCRSAYDLRFYYHKWYTVKDVPELLYDPPLFNWVLPALQSFPWLFPADPTLVDRGFIGQVSEGLPEQRAIFHWNLTTDFAMRLSIEGERDLNATLYNEQGQAIASTGGAQAESIVGATKMIQVADLPAGWYALGFHDGTFPTYFEVALGEEATYQVMLPWVSK